jgi:hypothetical protein
VVGEVISSGSSDLVQASRSNLESLFYRVSLPEACCYYASRRIGQECARSFCCRIKVLLALCLGCHIRAASTNAVIKRELSSLFLFDGKMIRSWTWTSRQVIPDAVSFLFLFSFDYVHCVNPGPSCCCWAVDLTACMF